MIILVSNYTLTKNPHMTSNFFIDVKNVKKIWDIDVGIIGMIFSNNYSKFEYRFKPKDSKIDAKMLVQLIVDNHKLGTTQNLPGDLSFN